MRSSRSRSCGRGSRDRRGRRRETQASLQGRERGAEALAVAARVADAGDPLRLVDQLQRDGARRCHGGQPPRQRCGRRPSRWTSRCPRGSPCPSTLPGHDLAGGKHVWGRLAVLEDDPGVLVHANTEVRERQSRPQRIGVVGGSVERASPVSLRRHQSGGRAIVQNCVVESSRTNCAIERPHCCFQGGRIESQLAGKLVDGLSDDGWKDRWNETAEGLRVDDGVGDLAGLLRDETPPYGIALGPEVLAFVVEALAVLVDDNAE